MTDHFLRANYRNLSKQQQIVANAASLIIASRFNGTAFTDLHFIDEEQGLEAEYVMRVTGANSAYIEGAFIASDDPADNYTIRVRATLTIEGKSAMLDEVGGVFTTGWQRTGKLIASAASDRFAEAA